MFITVLRTIIMYAFVIIGIRLMGKRQIGDMQPNELVVTLLISEIAAIPLQDTSQPVINGLAAIFMLVILEILLSVAAMKSFWLRKIISGKSVVIIKKGEIDIDAMRKVRMTVIDLVELLRAQNIFDIYTVDYAVLEVNGSLSVLLKGDYQPVCNSDAGIETKAEGLALPVIADGKIINESIKALSIDKSVIDRFLKKKKVTRQDILIMTVDGCGNIDAVKKDGDCL